MEPLPLSGLAIALGLDREIDQLTNIDLLVLCIYLTKAANGLVMDFFDGTGHFQVSTPAQIDDADIIITGLVAVVGRYIAQLDTTPHIP